MLDITAVIATIEAFGTRLVDWRAPERGVRFRSCRTSRGKIGILPHVLEPAISISAWNDMNRAKHRRVAVTGLGVISPLGNTVEQHWDGLINGRSGVRPITDFDVSNSSCKLAGNVVGFDPADFLPRRDLKGMDRFSQLGVAAAKMAWADAGLGNMEEPNNTGGVVIGTGIGGIPAYTEAYDALFGGPTEKRVNSYTIPKIMNNAVSSNIAIQLGITGRNITVNTACSSGANAIGQAFEWIRYGLMDTVICGGAEAPLTYAVLKAWASMGVLSRNQHDPPSSVCKPFDLHREGFVLGEGAGMLVLESLERAVQRDTEIYAELIGYRSNCDAYSLTSGTDEGISQAMESALSDANVQRKDQIAHINAHGTGTKLNDLLETKAIRRFFGQHAASLCVSSNKSMMGHAMGASSALEMVGTVLTVQNDRIPPTINYQTADPECDLNYVPNRAISQRVEVALSNSFAFGGSNAVLVVKKWKKN